MGNAPGRWPDFLIIGAAKAGTTALFRGICQHPHVYEPVAKEPRYLAYAEAEVRPEAQGSMHRPHGIFTQRNDYLALFADTPAGAITGEASTRYLADPGTPSAVLRLVPDARLVAILRHPVERAYSRYLHARQRGLESCPTFEGAWQAMERRNAIDPSSTDGYVMPGFYARHLTRWLALFPREQLLILFYEDWRDRPADVLARVWRHLGLVPIADPVITRENVSSRQPRWPWLHHRMLDRDNPLRRLADRALPRWARDAVARSVGVLNLRPGPQLDPDLRAHLARTYHADLAQLEALTGRDLTAWRT